MEYIDGLNLHEYLDALIERNMNIPKSKVMQVVLDIMSVLKYLHVDKKILHRDLNPSNIMITFDYNVKLTDFGLSTEFSQSLNKNSTFVGTLAYSSPEMVENKICDNKSDIWSFGCLIYELINMKPAFKASNALMLAEQITNGDYDKLKPKETSFHIKLIRLIESCLAADPEMRPGILEVIVLG